MLGFWMRTGFRSILPAGNMRSTTGSLRRYGDICGEKARNLFLRQRFCSGTTIIFPSIRSDSSFVFKICSTGTAPDERICSNSLFCTFIFSGFPAYSLKIRHPLSVSQRMACKEAVKTLAELHKVMRLQKEEIDAYGLSVYSPGREYEFQ